jgi:hypothetical protein
MYLLILIPLLGITSSIVHASSLYPTSNLHIKKSLLQKRDLNTYGNSNKYILKVKRDEYPQNQKRSYDQTLQYIKSAIESYKRENSNNLFNGATSRVPVESSYQGWTTPSNQPVSYPSKFLKDYSQAKKVVETQLAAKKNRSPVSMAQPLYFKANHQQQQQVRPQLIQKPQQQFTQQQQLQQPQQQQQQQQQQQHNQPQQQSQVQQQQQQQQQQQSQPQQQLQVQQQQHNQNQRSTILSNNNMATSNSDGQLSLRQSVQTESSPAVENGQVVPPPRPAYVSPPPYIDSADSPHSAQIRPNQAPNETSPSSTSQVEPHQLNSPSLQSSPQMTLFQDENSQPGLSATEGGSSQQVTSVEQNGFSEQQGLLTETIQDASSQQQQGFMAAPIEGGSSLQTEQGISVPVVEVQQNTPTQFIDPQNEQSDVAIPNSDNLGLSSMRKK